MSNLTDARTIVAAAHNNACDLWGQTCNVYLATNLIFTGLKCLIRKVNKQDLAVLTARGIIADMILEIPKQTTFTTVLKPKVHNIVFNTVRYEISGVTLGTLQTDSNGESPDAPVITLALSRLGSGGIGEGAAL